MLHHIDDQGNFSWTCPHCPSGPRQEHISHKHVQVSEMDPSHVLLPPCPCGSHTGVNVAFSAQDLLPPVIHYGTLATVPPREGIVAVEIPGAPNFTRIVAHNERFVVDGQERIVRIIDDVQQHPAIAHHLEMARQLQSIGKM